MLCNGSSSRLIRPREAVQGWILDSHAFKLITFVNTISAHRPTKFLESQLTTETLVVDRRIYASQDIWSFLHLKTLSCSMSSAWSLHKDTLVERLQVMISSQDFPLHSGTIPEIFFWQEGPPSGQTLKSLSILGYVHGASALQHTSIS